MTHEGIASTAVVPSGVPARGALLTRVRRVHQDQRDAGRERLVGHELAQLVERPALHAASVGLPSSGPRPNAGEVFAGQAMADLGIIAVLLLLPLILHILALHSFFVWVPLPVMSP